MSLWDRLWPFGRGHPARDPDLESWREERPERRRQSVETRDALIRSIARADRVQFEPTLRERLTGYDREGVT